MPDLCWSFRGAVDTEPRDPTRPLSPRGSASAGPELACCEMLCALLLPASRLNLLDVRARSWSGLRLRGGGESVPLWPPPKARAAVSEGLRSPPAFSPLRPSSGTQLSSRFLGTSFRYSPVWAIRGLHPDGVSVPSMLRAEGSF